VPVDIISSVFDAFLYGHPLIYEDVVEDLVEAGLEDWRYFNVFTIDPRYPQWHGFFADLHARIEAIDGTIPGVRYRYFGSPLGYDSIIDHTRDEVTRTVWEVIDEWADVIDAGHVHLDLAFDKLGDWMLVPGDEWPWPEEEMAERNRRWKLNMQTLVSRSERARPTSINASKVLDAPVVMFESQPSAHDYGRYTWQQYMERIRDDDVIPIMHVGHMHLYTLQATERGEALSAAAWLMAERAYLMVEFDWDALAFAGNLLEQGMHRFAADGPLEEIEPMRWRRTGRIDGVAYEVIFDTETPDSHIGPIQP
jgi:hypothetical protein